MSRTGPEPVKRRDFLGLAGLFAAGVALCGSLVGMLRLPKPRVTAEASSRFRIGPPQQFPPGTETNLPAEQVRIVSREDGIAALSLVCTHLGCVVKPDRESLLCPCHGSRFSLTGDVMAGPAPRPLRWLHVSQAADGTLLVDRAKEVPPEQRCRPQA